MKQLTAKIYLFIRTRCHADGVAPSRREIMAAFGISAGCVTWHVRKLIEAGAVTQERYKARTLRPTHEAKPTTRRKPVSSLEQQAADWYALGGVCIWLEDADGCYSGIQLLGAGRGVVAEVKRVEAG